MANSDHVNVLIRQLSELQVWNPWRLANPGIKPNLSGEIFHAAFLRGLDLSYSDLSGTELAVTECTWTNFSHANLTRADLERAILDEANLQYATLSDANLTDARLRQTNLAGANLRNANLSFTELLSANLSGADLRGANLRGARLIDVNLRGTDITGCNVYGVSAWDLEYDDDTLQLDLVVTKQDDPVVTADNIEVAQFIYLLLTNKKIKNIIDTVTSKVVLILGRFSPARKPILNAIHTELRRLNYLPVLFDFEKPGSRTFIETVATLAHMARFVIADVTDPKIVLHEIPHIVANISVPVVPILVRGSGKEPVTLSDLRRNHKSLLPTKLYNDLQDLLGHFGDAIVSSAEAVRRELDVS